MEKLNYWKSVFISWLKDMGSRKKIIQNGWHKHIFVSLFFIIGFAPLLKSTFKLNEALVFQYFVLLAVPLALYWVFEVLQNMYAKSKGKDRQVDFESHRDIMASWVISSVVGIIIYTILITSN